jgi:hypothetical protein
MEKGKSKCPPPKVGAQKANQSYGTCANMGFVPIMLDNHREQVCEDSIHSMEAKKPNHRDAGGDKWVTALP